MTSPPSNAASPKLPSTQGSGKRALVLACLVGGLCSLLVGGTRSLAVRIEGEGSDHGFAPDGEGRLRRDIIRLESVQLLRGRGEVRDAAPVLNRLLKSEVSSVDVHPAWWTDAGFYKTFKSLDGEEAPWLDHPELTSSLDLSFLSEWRSWDHWDWRVSPPYAESSSVTDEKCVENLRLPDVSGLLPLVKARLAQGWAGGDLELALADARHISMIVASSDTLIGISFAIRIRMIEEYTYQRALREGRVAADPVHQWSIVDLQRAKDTAWAVGDVMSSMPGSPLAAELASQQGLPGVCAGLVETVATHVFLEEAILQPWPGEIDHSDQVRGTRALLQSSTCAIEATRAAWARPPGESCLFRGTANDGESATGRRLLAFAWRIPWFRQPVIAWYRRSIPNNLGPYGVPDADR